MAHYLLSVHTSGQGPQSMSDDEMHKSFARIGALEQEMKTSGAFVFGGRLLEPEAATVVRVASGKVLTTDGPFTEAKEVIGGFYILEAEDLDAALNWAAKTTAAVGMPIEVRPFWGVTAAGVRPEPASAR